MKKVAVWVGAMILVMALCSPVMAQQATWMKEFKASSLLQIWTVWEPKFNFGIASRAANGNTTTNDVTRRQIHERLNFTLEWGNSKYAHAVLQFEADSTMWGEDPAGTATGAGGAGFGTNGPPFGTNGNGSGQTEANHMGVYRTDQVQLEIKWAYLDFTIPNTPVSIMAGMQSFNFGGRLWMLNDAPGIKAILNYAPHTVTAFWWRQNDRNNLAYWTNDTYGVEYSLTQKVWNLSVLGAYKNDQTNNTTPTGVASTSIFADQPWWVGIRGGFRPGNWNFYANFVYNGGTRDFLVESATIKDQDYEGWAAEALVQYTIGPGLSVAAEGLYTTGSDSDPGKADKIKNYTFPTTSEQESIFGNDRTVIFFMAFSNFGNKHNINFNYAGFAYARANLNYSPLPWLNFGFNYLYFWDTSKGPGAIKNTPINTASAVRQDIDVSSVGQEINLITKLRIYQNLTWQIGLAAFIPGKAFDAPNNDADTMYAVNTGMQLAF